VHAKGPAHRYAASLARNGVNQIEGIGFAMGTASVLNITARLVRFMKTVTDSS